MATRDINKAFLEAAEIAKKLPENLQEVGFSRALDHILGTSGKGTEPEKGRGQRVASTKKQSAKPNDDEWIEEIDRTAYPDIGATERVADRALKVLSLANLDHGIDGLTASQIATILTRKFRLAVKRNSIVKALDRETGNVDVRSGSGGSKLFHIMAPGEAYLQRLRSGESPPSSRARTAKRRAPKKTQEAGAPKKISRADKPPATAAKKPRRSVSSRPGPKAAVSQLIASGFFQSPRGIGEIQQELQHKKGHGYSIQELAPALVRSVRDNSLSRNRTDTGQYEYSEA